MRARLLLLCLGAALPALAEAPGPAPEQVIKIQAKKYEFIPPVVELKKGVPVILEFTALDRKHGVRQKELGLDLEVSPDKPARARVVPQKEGTYDYTCSVFCGSGHEDMAGQIVVKP